MSSHTPMGFMRCRLRLPDPPTLPQIKFARRRKRW